MNIKAVTPGASQLAAANTPAANTPTQADPKVRETFDQFVGETFYGQMLQSLRKTVGKTPYFNGGRGEEIFRGQLDQTLAQNMAKSDHGRFSSSMFDLFSLQRT
jgi:flagellar protein FlgJ